MMREDRMDSPGGSGSDDLGVGGQALKKGPWTAAEDNILVAYVQKHGEGNWNNVQKQSGLFRCGKSCRLRWANHLRPNLKKGAFTPEEERLIIELHAKLGNKWARMATQLPGRTDNEIKNYWNTRIKRRQRAGLPVYPPDIQAAINSGTSSSSSSKSGHPASSSGPLYPSFSALGMLGSSGKITAAAATHHDSNTASLLDSSGVPEFHGLTLQALQQGMVGPLFLAGEQHQQASSTGSSSTECGSANTDGSKAWGSPYDRSLQMGSFSSHRSQQQEHHSVLLSDLDHQYRQRLLACAAASSNDSVPVAGLRRSNTMSRSVEAGAGHYFVEQGEPSTLPPPPLQPQPQPQLFSTSVPAAALGHDSFLLGSHHGSMYPTSCSRPIAVDEHHQLHSDLKLELPSSQLSAAESTSDSTVTPPCGTTSQISSPGCRPSRMSSGSPRYAEDQQQQQRYDNPVFWQQAAPASFPQEQLCFAGTAIKLEDPIQQLDHPHFSLLDPYARPRDAPDWYAPPQGGLYLEMDAMTQQQQPQPQPASQHDNTSGSIDSVFSHAGRSSTAAGLMGMLGHGSNPPTSSSSGLGQQQQDEEEQLAMHRQRQQMLGPRVQTCPPPEAAAVWELGCCSWNNMPGACQVGEYDCRAANCLNEQLGCAIY